MEQIKHEGWMLPMSKAIQVYDDAKEKVVDIP